MDYPKTHNLRVLIELLAMDDIRLRAELADIDRLTQSGTTFRYDTVLTGDVCDRAIWLRRIQALRVFIEPLISG